MPEWNLIYDESRAEYGETIKFIKIDGSTDRYTATRYEIEKYPSFIALRPGSHGEDWHLWEPRKRSYHQMKKWINALIQTYDIRPSASASEPKEDKTSAIKTEKTITVNALDDRLPALHESSSSDSCMEPLPEVDEEPRPARSNEADVYAFESIAPTENIFQF